MTTISSFRKGLRTGVIFGIIIIFLALIGFTMTAPALIGKLYGKTGTEPATVMTNFYIFMALIGIWNGAVASKPAFETSSWKGAFIGSAAAGITTGLMSAILNYIISSLNINGVDMRGYLVALSSDTITLFSFNQTPLGGSIIHIVLFTITGIIAGLTAEFFRIGTLPESIRKRTEKLLGSTIRSSGFVSTMRSQYVKYILIALLAAALIIFPRQWGSYWNYVMGTVGIYVMLGLGMNIIMGLSGQLVLGYVAFFAIGAYTFALLTAPKPHGLLVNFWVSLVMGVFAATLAGILLGLPILGLRSDYLAIVTLGFGEMVRILIKSDILTFLTAGPKGVRDIGGPTLMGKPFSSHIDFMYLIIIAVIILTFITQRLQNSRTGRSWVSIREDETVARATGINTDKSRILALAIGAAFAGLGGALFASRNQFTGPEDHAMMVSINVICLVIVGGMGSLPGIFLGAFALKGLPELLREMENYRMLFFGALLVVMMLIRPEGLWPANRPRIEKYDELKGPQPPDAHDNPDSKVIDNGQYA